MPALLQTDLPFPLHRGKVRDVYDLGDVNGQPALLIVATDRISAFDVVINEPIPGKGKILTALSLFWFRQMAGVIENHLITADVEQYPPRLRQFADILRGRSMLVKRTRVVPIECVARGYLAGSGWAEYHHHHTVAQIPLTPGLQHCQRLPKPLFTPATKEANGHDINISFEEMAKRVGQPTVNQLRDITLSIYQRAADFAAARGIIIADTKFEFGWLGDGDSTRLILIDEILTPDSSRFWAADDYEPGHDQASFDKQFLRNWLLAQPWKRTPPAPPLPPEIIAGTRLRYAEAHRRLCGTVLADADTAPKLG